MIEWSWRIEDSTSCPKISATNPIDEIVVALSEDLYVSSFMTADGGPVWALKDRREAAMRTLSVKQGRLELSIYPPNE